MSTARIVTGPEITDAAGTRADRRQVDRMNARYRWSASRIGCGDVAEIACGTGQGLGLLAQRAKSVVGADYSRENLAIVRETYGDRVSLVQCDAQRLPFANGSLDAVIILEALYFLPSEDDFFAEARRCLRPGRTLLISVINRDTVDYNPRPMYYRHYGVRELVGVCHRYGFAPDVFGSIPLRFSLRERLLRPAKRIAVRFDLVPKTNASRTWLKRFVFGELELLPREITSTTKQEVAPQPLDPAQPDTVHQVVLCAATRNRD